MRLHRQARLPVPDLALLQTLALPVLVLHLDLDPVLDQFLHLPLLPAVPVLVAPALALRLSDEGALLEYLSEAARPHQSLRKLLHLQGKYLLYLSRV